MTGKGTPVLFLDIDGVLNTPTIVREGRIRMATQDGRKMRMDSYVGPNAGNVHHMLDRDLVIRLSNLVKLAKCRVVLHTTWIFLFTTEEIAAALDRAGFTAVCEFYSCARRGSREDRINEWRYTHKALEANYAVLDDVGRGSEFPTAADGHLVQTNYKLGLTRDNAEDALRLLQR